MDNRVEVLTFGQLKKIILELANTQGVQEKTKVFIDTGWDSVQEVDPKSISLEDVVEFSVHDELTKEAYVGFSLKEKRKENVEEELVEKAIIIRNLY